MKAVHILLVLFCLIVLSGCDSIRRDQIRVESNLVSSTDSARQEAKVVEALALVAQRLGFSDELRYARLEGVVAYFIEDVEDFPISFGARRVDGGLIVDIQHFAPGTRKSARYLEVRAAITQELSVSLGAGSFTLLERQNYEP